MAKRPFLVNMHYFRAFAIINVMLVHLWRSVEDPAVTASGKLVNAISGMLFHDSTIYFIFISGFLFHYLSARFELKKYYKNKLLNVVTPYVILSTGAFLVTTIYHSTEITAGGYIEALLNGLAQVQYWYIPFICLVFVVSPVLLKIPDDKFLKLALVVSVLPFLGTRTSTFITLWQYLYFLPIYMAGMACSMFYDDFFRLISARKYQLMILAAASSAIILTFRLYEVKPELGPLNFMETLYYIQKMALTFLAVIFLSNYEQNTVKSLDLIANLSFALYFTHMFFFSPTGLAFVSEVLGPTPFFISSLIYAVGVLLLSLGACMVAKKVLGKHSRLLIGA